MLSLSRVLVGAVVAALTVGFTSTRVAGISAVPFAIVRWLSHRSPNVFFYAETTERVVALTIDDAPDTTTTSAILDILAEQQVPATFFVIGDRIDGSEALLRRAVAEGHELGNHLMRDEPSAALPLEDFEAQLLATDSLLRAFAPVAWFRPGSGWYTRAMTARALRCGYRCALGSVYPFDAQIPIQRFLTWDILKMTRPGSVIILHDGPERGTRTATVLRIVLPELKRRGYRFVTLSQLARLDRRVR